MVRFIPIIYIQRFLKSIKTYHYLLTIFIIGKERSAQFHAQITGANDSRQCPG